jgi:asparagine synthase (glutamine-hydrolysing)
MCGISGFYSKKRSFSREDLERITRILHHRGPDGEGYFQDEVVGLGHTRLKIIDLSENAAQPMYSHNKRYVMIYNGEVYNYAELRDELTRTRQGIQFRSSSDTEVILEAFVAWGPEFVHRLNGMFAIVIYDTAERELYIFRDRLGIKPFYYYQRGDDVVFASELKALLRIPQPDFTFDHSAIVNFLHLGYIPSPKSIYTQIRKMEPGTYMRVNEKGMSFQRYWSPVQRIAGGVMSDEEESFGILKQLVESSVHYQLISDVPTGVFLSGGIDSSLITAIAARKVSGKLNTFSIGFEESSHNEAGYAKKVAEITGTAHHELILSYKDAINLIMDDFFTAYKEPLADSSCIPTMILTKFAKQNVTVALSGEGGDELFFGYGFYRWAKRLNNPLVRLVRKPASALLSRFSSDKYRRASTLFDFKDDATLHSHIFSQEQYLFSEDELGDLLEPGFAAADAGFIDRDFREPEEVRELSSMESQALFDMTYYLPDDLLTKMDRASMHYSLEARVPYLDHRLVEFALNLAPSLKYRNSTSKYLLKKLLYTYLPRELFQRPKQGFSVPLGKWLEHDLRYLIDEFLSPQTIHEFGMVQYAAVEKLKREFFAGKKYLYNRLWVLIILHKWLRSNK